jgi:hypothetical protein
MARVTRQAGKIVAFEPDGKTFILKLGEREVPRKNLSFWCDHIPTVWAGRWLYTDFLVINSLPLARKIFDLETTVTLAVRAGIVSSRQAESRAEGQSRADAAGLFLVR